MSCPNCHCPQCIAAQAEATTADQAAHFAFFHSTIRASGYRISPDGRVSERTVAALFDMKLRQMQILRNSGKGPRYVKLAFDGCHYSYKIADLAEYMQGRKRF